MLGVVGDFRYDVLALVIELKLAAESGSEAPSLCSQILTHAIDYFGLVKRVRNGTEPIATRGKNRFENVLPALVPDIGGMNRTFGCRPQFVEVIDQYSEYLLGLFPFNPEDWHIAANRTGLI